MFTRSRLHYRKDATLNFNRSIVYIEDLRKAQIEQTLMKGDPDFKIKYGGKKG